MNYQRSLLEETLVELRSMSASEGRQDAIDLVQSLIADDDKPLPIVEYDPDILTDFGDTTRMVLPDEIAKRYSPDQPREHGKFAPAGGKQSELDDDDKKNLKTLMNIWVEGGSFLGQIQRDTIDMINKGKADNSVMVHAIRAGEIDRTVYRGVHNVPDDFLEQIKSGTKMELMPQSFSESKSTAVDFARSNIYTKTASGGLSESNGKNSIVYVAKVSNGIRVRDHLEPEQKKTFGGLKEVVTAGRFKITGVTRVGRINYVGLEQTGLY